MKKFTFTSILLILMMMTTTVFATTEVTMEIVEDNICTIDFENDCSFEKKIVNSDLPNHNVTLQLKITNNSQVMIPTGELMLVIDSSQSMDTIVEGQTTRKDLVLDSANKLVKNLLKVNPTSLKIGVVTFSTGSEKNEDGFLITGTEADAQKVCDFSNDLSLLTSKISAIEGTGQYTNLDSGLELAVKQFSSDNTNKYMIVLTDGLPNLAIGYNDLVSYDGLTDVITKTNSTLSSLNNIEVITMLTGISDTDAIIRMSDSNYYTYGDVINAVFGTEEKPTIGKFYNINDSEIGQTITNNIYNDLLPVEKCLNNITIIDYIPQYISDNFNVSINQDSLSLSAIISDDSRTITWNLDELASGETQTLKFDLTLKNEFDETIINKILNTNEKVDVNYNDFDGRDKSVTSDVTPKIRLLEVPQEVPDVAPTPIPKAGLPIFTFVFIFSLICSLYFGYKAH